MVLPQELVMAAFFGRVAKVTAFLENNPESVDDVSEGDRPATMLQTAALANMVSTFLSMGMRGVSSP